MIIGEVPFTIEWMIENTLLHSILDFVLEQIIKPCTRRSHDFSKGQFNRSVHIDEKVVHFD
jgi:hypothetical protein